MSVIYRYKNPVWAGIVLIFLALFVSGHFELYNRIAYLDKAFHFFGGVVMAWFFGIYLRKELASISKGRQLLFVVACVGFVGVGWEFAEYLAHVYGPVYSPWLMRYFDIGDLADTLSDLVLDLLGGLVFFMLSRKPAK